MNEETRPGEPAMEAQAPSEPPPPTKAAPSRPRRPLPKWARMSAVAGLVLVLVALLIWSQGCEADRQKGAVFAQSVDGLAAALTNPVFETGSVRFENRTERLQAVVESVARQGRYDTVIVTDSNGAVLATSDTRFRGQTIVGLDKAKTPAEAVTVDGARQADAPMRLPSGQTIGYLRVRTRL